MPRAMNVPAIAMDTWRIDGPVARSTNTTANRSKASRSLMSGRAVCTGFRDAASTSRARASTCRPRRDRRPPRCLDGAPHRAFEARERPLAIGLAERHCTHRRRDEVGREGMQIAAERHFEGNAMGRRRQRHGDRQGDLPASRSCAVSRSA